MTGECKLSWVTEDPTKPPTAEYELMEEAAPPLHASKRRGNKHQGSKGNNGAGSGREKGRKTGEKSDSGAAIVTAKDISRVPSKHYSGTETAGSSPRGISLQLTSTLQRNAETLSRRGFTHNASSSSMQRRGSLHQHHHTAGSSSSSSSSSSFGVSLSRRPVSKSESHGRLLSAMGGLSAFDEDTGMVDVTFDQQLRALVRGLML